MVQIRIPLIMHSRSLWDLETLIIGTPLQSSMSSSIRKAPDRHPCSSLCTSLAQVKREGYYPFLMPPMEGCCSLITTGQVLQALDLWPKGLTPSIAKPSLKCLGLHLNSGHVSLMWAQARESVGTRIKPSFEQFWACHVSRSTLPWLLNMCCILGIIGKYLSTF